MSSYVIDGYQRLTTLYSVLKRNDGIKLQKENIKYTIYYNTESSKLEHHRSDQSSNPDLVPLHALWTTTDLLEISRLIDSRNAPETRAIVRNEGN